jgi:hypothetical protein
MDEPDAVESAITRAREWVLAMGLEVGPVVTCFHNTRTRLQALLNEADPATPGYDSGLRLLAKFEDHWVVRFAKQLPDGVVECPSTICVRVYDHSGVIEFV